MTAATQHLLLFYYDEQEWADRSDDERAAIAREYYAVVDELREQGGYVTGAPLQPTASATTVRVRDDEPVVTDGPFAETKEQLGGYYLIDVDSLDEALEWAAKIPTARRGSVEVRPLMQVPTEARA